MPIPYYYLKIFISGLIVLAFIQFAYIYIKMPMKETRAALLISGAAFLYIISEIITFLFTVIMPMEGAVNVLLILRESVPLVILFIGPFSINLLYDFKGRIKTVNQVFFLVGIAAALIIPFTGAFFPRLFIENEFMALRADSGEVSMQNAGLLLVIRNVLILAYMIYATITIADIQNREKNQFPDEKHYNKSRYSQLYCLYLSLRDPLCRKDSGADHGIFPYQTLAFGVFILFLSLAMMDFFINYNNQLHRSSEPSRHGALL